MVLLISTRCSDAYSDTMLGYANSIRTVDGGTHIEGIKASLTRTLNNLAKKSKIIKVHLFWLLYSFYLYLWTSTVFPFFLLHFDLLLFVFGMGRFLYHWHRNIAFFLLKYFFEAKPLICVPHWFFCFKNAFLFLYLSKRPEWIWKLAFRPWWNTLSWELGLLFVCWYRLYLASSMNFIKFPINSFRFSKYGNHSILLASIDPSKPFYFNFNRTWMKGILNFTDIKHLYLFPGKGYHFKWWACKRRINMCHLC